MKRIDSLKPGTKVTLAFHKRASTVMTKGGRIDEEVWVFVCIKGTGGDRRAVFCSATDPSDNWEAYRYNGGWAFGSSAERLSLVKIHED